VGFNLGTDTEGRRMISVRAMPGKVGANPMYGAAKAIWTVQMILISRGMPTSSDDLVMHCRDFSYLFDRLFISNNEVVEQHILFEAAVFGCNSREFLLR
jgi:hypothetical protein